MHAIVSVLGSGFTVQSAGLISRSARKGSLINFHVYGLDFASEIAFPALPPAKDEPNIHIRFGKVPDEIPDVSNRGVLFQASDRQFLLKFEPVGRFLVSDGDEILVEPSAGASESEVRHFLMGSPLGALLHQRGILALHASAVSTTKGAVLFAGLSATGKSALACAFLLKGYDLLTDEVSCLALDGSFAFLNPGPSEVILWPDVIAKLGISQSDLELVRKGVNKHRLSISRMGEPNPVPIRTIYILEPGSMEMSISELKGFEKISALTRQVYRVGDVTASEKPASHLSQIFELARCARVCLIRRPRSRFGIDKLVGAIEQDLDA